MTVRVTPSSYAPETLNPGGVMSQAAPYTDRAEAGRILAEALREKLPDPGDALVLALPRGGVPVGFEVAEALEVPLDLMLVRKLGLPGQPELAMGAIASGGVRVLNAEVVSLAGVPEATIASVERRERAELERREKAYRGDRPPARIEGRTIILVDDGVATGSTMTAAVRAVRERNPRRVVVAAPVASPEVAASLRGEADLVVCPRLPTPFFAIGCWYLDFPQLTDEDVARFLRRAWSGEDLRALRGRPPTPRRGRGGGAAPDPRAATNEAFDDR